MDLSLDDLLSGLEAAQQKKSKVGWRWVLQPPLSRPAVCRPAATIANALGGTETNCACATPPLQVRLSERNVVELVAKLRQLGLLGDELLYTTNGGWAGLMVGKGETAEKPAVAVHTLAAICYQCNVRAPVGKEYVTRQRVEAEVRAAVRAAGGRIPLVSPCNEPCKEREGGRMAGMFRGFASSVHPFAASHARPFAMSPRHACQCYSVASSAVVLSCLLPWSPSLPVLPQVDLPTQLGLDLVHCERAAEAVVSAADGAITQAQVRWALGVGSFHSCACTILAEPGLWHWPGVSLPC